MSRSILVVDDEVTLAKNISKFLAQNDYQTRVAHDGRAALDAFDKHSPDVVLLDLQLPDMNGLDILRELRDKQAVVRVIVCTGHGSVQAAVDAMKRGADDYLTKPLVLAELKLLLEKLAGQDRIESALAYYQHREASQSGIARLLGESHPIRSLRTEVEQYIHAEHSLTDGRPPPVLITGETGTGKELVARSFHFDGPRKERPFVEINCASIPTDLLEAELFGFERGAFTDARSKKIGLIESADGGTLFLDELGELDFKMQAKLLKVLEDGRIRRIGSVNEIKVNTRIIAATNQDLSARIAEGEFRADLYFRLNVLRLELPALRERPGDAVLLAQHCLQVQGARYGRKGLRFDDAALSRIDDYDWPGNVRELRNVVERAVLVAKTDVIGVDHIGIEASKRFSSNVGSADLAPAADDKELDDGIDDDLADEIGDFDLAAQELRLIRAALERCNGNVSKAARLLGLSRDTLRYRLEKHNLSKAR